MRLSLFSHTASGNAVGRVYSLWLLAEELGWDTRIHVPDIRRVWAPLEDDQRFCSRLTTSLDEATSADVLVAVKPLLGSFAVALKVQRSTKQPLVLDVDDPDWQWAYGFGRGHALTRGIYRTLRGRPNFPVRRPGGPRREHLAAYREFRLGSKGQRESAVAISNPELARWYPGVLIPHVRLPTPLVAAPGGPGLRIVFVGTIRGHKGIEVLRAAARAVEGVRLVITADAPPDAAPHEEWVGQTTLEAGLRIVEEADAVALPSLDTGYARYQLPVKLIDAMVAGRAIVASDLAPLRWAAEGAALFVPPGDVESLAQALRRLCDDELRRRLAEHGRARALAQFTPTAVAPVFAGLVERARREARAECDRPMWGMMPLCDPR